MRLCCPRATSKLFPRSKSAPWILGLGLLLAASPARARTAPPAPEAPGIDKALAARLFQEAKAISDKDAGKMWGQPLYGSMLFVEPDTREVVANRPDYQNLLKPIDDLFVGTLPDHVNIANTAARWAGVDWTMVRWPLPEEKLQRDVLMIHESFHRIQDQLGLGGSDPSCDHLDTRDGRIWLQLEWRALMTALEGPPKMRKKAVEDALLFRAYRRSLFKDAAAREQALEMHEGIPEYTGVALSAKDRAQALDYAAAEIQAVASYATYVRSFAYATGPAYGLLLDEAKPGWQRALKVGDDVSVLLASASKVVLPADLGPASETRAKVYGGRELTAAEDERAQAKAKELLGIRARFVDGPVLFLPIASGFSYSFDPTNQVPLEGLGVVYPYLRVTSDWGILEARKGALMLKKGDLISGVRVDAPKNLDTRPLQGDGWTLTLDKNWTVVPGERKGDYELKQAGIPLQ
jgi:hypothetical protein